MLLQCAYATRLLFALAHKQGIQAVSNLDLHLQTSALSLLKDLQDKTGIAYLFVTHDLRLVERFASRVLIMDAGRIVEETATGALAHVSHPASLLLKSAILPAYPRRAA